MAMLSPRTVESVGGGGGHSATKWNFSLRHASLKINMWSGVWNNMWLSHGPLHVCWENNYRWACSKFVFLQINDIKRKGSNEISVSGKETLNDRFGLPSHLIFTIILVMEEGVDWW